MVDHGIYRPQPLPKGPGRTRHPNGLNPPQQRTSTHACQPYHSSGRETGERSCPTVCDPQLNNLSLTFEDPLFTTMDMVIFRVCIQGRLSLKWSYS